MIFVRSRFVTVRVKVITQHNVHPLQTMSVNNHQSIARVADAGLFATHIFPLVLQLTDKRNCMLVCKQWYKQMRTSSAWRHVRKVKIGNYGSHNPVLRIPMIPSDVLRLGILSSPLSPAIVPDEHVLLVLRLCTNVRTIDWDDRMTCGGVDMLIGWLDEGKVMWPKLSFIKCRFWSTDLHHNLAKFDYLLSTTFKQVQTIGLDFCAYNLPLPPTEEQQQQYERDCTNALATLLSHHVHKLHELHLWFQLCDRLDTAVVSSVLHAQPTALKVLSIRVFSFQIRQMLIDVINLQRGGTLTELHVSDCDWHENRADNWRALINAIDRCTVQNLQMFRAVEIDNISDICGPLSEKCEKLKRLTIPQCISLTFTEFTTFVQHFTNARDNFTFECKRANIDDDEQGRDIRNLPADQLATALRNQFDVLQFDGNVEKTDKGFRCRVNNCEFVFQQWLF